MGSYWPAHAEQRKNRITGNLGINMYKLQTMLWHVTDRWCCTKPLYLPERVLDASPSAVTSNLFLVILSTADGEHVQRKSKLSPKEKYIKPHEVLWSSFSAIVTVSKIFKCCSICRKCKGISQSIWNWSLETFIFFLFCTKMSCHTLNRERWDFWPQYLIFLGFLF